MLVRQVAMKTAPVRHVQEDIAHDVFVDFLSKYDQWDYDPTTIKALLTRMTKITALQYWRNYLKNLPERLREATEHLAQRPGQAQRNDVANEVPTGRVTGRGHGSCRVGRHYGSPGRVRSPNHSRRTTATTRSYLAARQIRRLFFGAVPLQIELPNMVHC